MEPFRDRHRTCPACQALLREHASRLVCDTCHGIQLELGDLVGAIRELVSVEPTLQMHDETPGSRACPTCSTSMRQTKLRVVIEGKPLAIRATLDLCDVHGLWCDDGELAQVFEVVHRRMSPQHDRDHRPLQSERGAPWWKTWRVQPVGAEVVPRPSTDALYRDEFPRCPACSDGLLERTVEARMTCGRCGGMWLPFDDLARAMDEVVLGPSETRAVAARTAGTRACPACRATLQPCHLSTAPLEALYQRSRIELDRCPTHGMWLDPGELAALMEETTAAVRAVTGQSPRFELLRWIVAKLRGRA